MLHPPLSFPPGPRFWDLAAQAILEDGGQQGQRVDLAGMRVVVPTVAHAFLLQQALAARVGRAFIPPRICTMASWLALQPPGARAASPSERLMSLYAELRQHAWLKKLFSARSNTDLLPLAQTLLALCDELTQALLPAMEAHGADAASRWEAALAQLSPAAQSLLSSEAQLVWSVWQAQLDGSDALSARFGQMMALAERAAGPLWWIAPAEPVPFETAFVKRYAQRAEVRSIVLGWREDELPVEYVAAWPELFDTLPPEAAALAPAPEFDLFSAPAPLPAPVPGSAHAPAHAPASAPITGLSLAQAGSLEEHAVRAAQTIIDWLAAGKTRLAIVAQDRVVARRVRALLERAEVFVADETGWKISTTRAAAALAAWFDVVSSRADTVALLDLLKSPFVLGELQDKADAVYRIEVALRRANVSGGWTAAAFALERLPQERALVDLLAREAQRFRGRRTVLQWLAETGAMLDALHMRAALEADAAGLQLLQLFEQLRIECAGLDYPYSFAEWRALLNLQMESLPFITPVIDKRVVMLPLNGARLRSFDAVVLVGADAEHLPSQPNETLFFANAVRRELSLDTRESRQRQQLRDFAELLQSSQEVVLFWQAHKDSEPNPESPWIARLALTLQRAGLPPLPPHLTVLARRRLAAQIAQRPLPSAPLLAPQKLSASGYNSMVACPYQFFATRMLGLSAMDELSELPEKRDYGDWLHRILKLYHEAVRDEGVAIDDRAALMARVSEQVFGPELEKNAGALGYSIRWQKAAPAYMAWANAREAQGWHFAFGERALESVLELPDGASILLHGRIDRIDENAQGGRAVIDYKTKDVDSLKKRIREREDHQLAFYGLLSDQPVEQALFVALELKAERTGEAEAPDFPAWQEGLRSQVVNGISAVRQGAPLPASGINTVCQYCDVRGLCRKGSWE